jgi:hypothetical protein
MRKRRYDEGGEVDPMEAANASPEAQDIADSLKRGAPGMSETITPMAKAAPKQRMVTKEELEKSGLSLRDYLNKQQGLTRRGESAPAPAAAPSAPRDTGDEAARMANRFKKPALRQETMRERAESYNRKRGIPGYKEGGSVGSASKRADGIAQRGKTRGKMC